MIDTVTLPTLLFHAAQAMMAVASVTLFASYLTARWTILTGRATHDHYPWLTEGDSTAAH